MLEKKKGGLAPGRLYKMDKSQISNLKDKDKDRQESRYRLFSSLLT